LRVVMRRPIIKIDLIPKALLKQGTQCSLLYVTMSSMKKTILLSLIAATSLAVIPSMTATNNSSVRVEAKSATAASEKNKEHKVAKIYEFKEKSLDGKQIDFSGYKGDVLLVVNTASKCGYTPQYKGLEELNKKYSAKGLKVLGFPCNQFKAQEPGDAAEIHDFCQKNYGVDFQMFDKIDVNGENANPLYTYLKEAAPEEKGADIRWNFTKFLIDRKGDVVKRFDSKVTPEDLVSDIEKVL
jgi:glutathione peroxidase